MIGYKAAIKTPMTHDDLPDLITAAKGDPAAFGRLYDRYLQPVYHYLYLYSRLGYEFEIATVQAVTFSDIETPAYIDGSQGYDYGYQFIVESDPSLGLSVEMDIRADKCWLSDVKKIEPSPLLYTQLCRDEYPKGIVTVTIREMSVTLEENLQVEWKPFFF